MRFPLYAKVGTVYPFSTFNKVLSLSQITEKIHFVMTLHQSLNTTGTKTVGQLGQLGGQLGTLPIKAGWKIPGT